MVQELVVSQNKGYPFWGVPIIGTIVFWGRYWGPLILGNYHIGVIQGYLEISRVRQEYIGISRVL